MVLYVSINLIVLRNMIIFLISATLKRVLSANHFHSQDLNINSLQCLLYFSFKFGSENLVLHQQYSIIKKTFLSSCHLSAWLYINNVGRNSLLVTPRKERVKQHAWFTKKLTYNPANRVIRVNSTNIPCMPLQC